MNTSADEKKDLPKWMTATDSQVVIALTVPTEFNGIMLDKLTLRYPKLGDMRMCQKANPHDEEAHDLMLFASLAGVGQNELLQLSVRDYNRVSSGYFRLVSED